MTAYALRFIYCDGCGAEAEHADYDLANVRSVAKRAGWQVARPGGKDLCPDCASKDAGQ